MQIIDLNNPLREFSFAMSVSSIYKSDLNTAIKPISDVDSSVDQEIVYNKNWSTQRSFFRWFHPDDGPDERKLILKLDIYILAFACIAFWVCH
jgi:hypothetical protein